MKNIDTSYPAGEITDETIMWFGDHKGKPMEDVPADYLMHLHTQELFVISENLKEYIEENMDVIVKEIQEAVLTRLKTK